MRKIFKYILSIVTLASCISASAADYDFHWAREYIDEAVKTGAVTDAQSFRPDDYITRAEFAAMIVRDKKLSLGAYPTAFFDVDEAAWYFPYVAAAENKGIVTGDESYNFNPEAYITRQDAAVILGRAYGVPTQIGFDLTRHRDGIYISQYALGYMTYMTNYGIINGFENGYVRPLDKVTRAQTAAMLSRIKSPVKIENDTQQIPVSKKISFKRGYPSVNDTGASGGFNMSFKTDKECDIFYKAVKHGTEVSEDEINTFLCHAKDNSEVNAFFAYEQTEADIYILAVGGDGEKSRVEVMRDVIPLCFDRGTGTVRDPYIVSNQTQLQAMGRYPKKFFALGTNIELDDSFEPIGSAYEKKKMFSGGLDGRGHTISNLSVDSNEKFVGLFSYLDGATVKNLYVSARTVSGMNDVGIITGENNGGTIENCFVTGVVSAVNNNAGGITGTNNGYIKNCASAAAMVESSMYAGGIAGVNFANIENSSSYSHTVTAQMYAGGIAASNSGGLVRSCLSANMNIETMITANSGRITTNLAGGVCENNYCYDKANALVSNSYNDEMTQNGANVSWNKLFDNGFYRKTLKWDMNDVWKQADENDILLLPTPSGFGSGYKTAGLTEFTPIHVGTEDELLRISESPHMHYILTDNIILTGPWKTICPDAESKDGGFSGSFNGNGHYIEKLSQKYDENIQLYGFVGLLDGGTLRNVKIKAAEIDGGRYIGGICAVNRGLIYGSEFDGRINAHDTASLVSVGGICAMNYGELEECRTNAEISAFANGVTAGGITAHNENKISKCSADGIISVRGMKAVSNSTMGGITGYNSSGDIHEVFSSVTFSAYSDTVYSGGVCGMLDTGEIYKGSAVVTGDINDAGGNGSKLYFGGITGLSNGGSVVHCLSSGELSAKHGISYLGGITGYNVSALIQNTYSTARLVQTGTGSFAGGIAGCNETGYIMYNAALNPSVRSDGCAARVCADSTGGSVEENFAASEMLVNYLTAEDSMQNGTGKMSSQMKSEFFFKPVYGGGLLGWSSVKYDGENGVWTGGMNTGGYYNLPLLNGVDGQQMFTTPVYSSK